MAPKKDSSTQVNLTIDEGTTIVIEEVEYSGTVSVESATADKLIDTGRASIVIPKEEVKDDASTGNE